MAMATDANGICPSPVLRSLRSRTSQRSRCPGLLPAGSSRRPCCTPRAVEPVSERSHPCSASDDALLADSDVTRQRRSGPGGQHRNKVETAIRLRHRPTGLEAQAAERRSQAENLRVAIRRLRLLLAVEVRQNVDQDEPLSDLWESRCRNGRIVVSPEHDDFPSIIAEALDVLASRDFDVPGAAAQLRSTRSQLVKLLRELPPAFARVNAERAARGLPALR